MLKRTIAYTNYNGDPVQEDFYFNITKSELILLETSEDGGMYNQLTAIVNKKDAKNIMKFFYDFIMLAYGEKSPDGRRFIKSPELSKAFSETPAFDQLFEELVFNAEKAAEFVNALIPDMKEPTPKLEVLNAAP